MLLWQNGTLKIIDRKKHIFKLAQGEYIAPEKIENIYARSSAVAQIYVHGDSLQVGECNMTSSVPFTTSTFSVLMLVSCSIWCLYVSIGNQFVPLCTNNSEIIKELWSKHK